MHVVALAAHPDDIELTCGGLMLRYADEGVHQLTVIVASDGAMGASSMVEDSQLVETRASEARSASEHIGAEYRNLGFPDAQLFDTHEFRIALTKALREANADVIISPPPDDYNADHVAVAHAATAAALWTVVPGLKDCGPILARTPRLYYCDVIGGCGEPPSLYVDVSAVFDRKLSLIHQHASQFSLTEAMFGVNLAQIATITAEFRGLQAGVRYAEAFRPALSWPRIRPGCDLPR